MQLPELLRRQKFDKLPELSERQVDFVMHSAEARLELPGAEPLDIVETVVETIKINTPNLGREN